MSYRPSKRRRGRYPEMELNLTSLMDMMTILQLFLLVTVSFAKITIIDTYLPQDSGVETASTGKAPEVLVINVTENGFEIGGLGDGVSIPKSSGNLDFKSLRTELLKIKDRYPDKEEVILLFSPDTPYDTVVKVMDATRETPDGSRKLFSISSLGEGR